MPDRPAKNASTSKRIAANSEPAVAGRICWFIGCCVFHLPAVTRRVNWEIGYVLNVNSSQSGKFGLIETLG